MIISSTTYFDKKLAKKLIKNPQLRKKVGKQLRLLQNDIRHPSLKTHKLEGKKIDEYTIWIMGNLRITFQIINNTILLTDIITHDEY